MTNVGPSTPIGTLCVYIGPDYRSKSGVLLCATGEQVRLAITSPPPRILGEMFKQALGYYPECGVETVAAQNSVSVLFQHLIRVDGDDPDAGERIADDQPTEITA